MLCCTLILRNCISILLTIFKFHFKNSFQSINMVIQLSCLLDSMVNSVCTHVFECVCVNGSACQCVIMYDGCKYKVEIDAIINK